MYGPFSGEFMGTLVLILLADGAADGYPGPKGWGAKSSAAVLSKFVHLGICPNRLEWHVNVANAGALADTLSRERDRALLFRTLATLRTDIGRVTLERCHTRLRRCRVSAGRGGYRSPAADGTSFPEHADSRIGWTALVRQVQLTRALTSPLVRCLGSSEPTCPRMSRLLRRYCGHRGGLCVCAATNRRSRR